MITANNKYPPLLKTELVDSLLDTNTYTQLENCNEDPGFFFQGIIQAQKLPQVVP